MGGVLPINTCLAVTDKFGDLRFTVSNFMSELQFYGRESILLVVREKLLRGLSGL